VGLHNYYALSVNKIPVAVLGGTGYAGATLCELIDRHPAFELAFATARTRGELRGSDSQRIPVMPVDEAPLDSARVVFSALPHGVSAQWVERARSAGARVIDLSSDLRPGSGAVGIPYGLTELARDEVRGADVVANPGCYPTAVLLALAPLLRRGLIATGATIAATAASGVTGAGASPKKELMFAEVADNYRAYGVGNAHRHVAELQAMVARHGADADLVFTPHLLPVARGILATTIVPVSEPIRDPIALWREDYAGEPFVEIANEPPSLRDVVGRNVARVYVTTAANAKRPALIVISAIDNLLKGAGGQAVQNANLMLGLDECAGLPR
jgi:N-acetyl-gamma-glutamyl-phosphate reductase